MKAGRKARSVAAIALATVSACAALAVLEAAKATGTRVVWHTWQDAQPGAPWTLHMGLINFDESAKPSLAAYARLPR